MSDSLKISSKDLFIKYCQENSDIAIEFINDYILYLLDMKTDLESESYKDIQKFFLDFMIGCDEIFQFYFDFATLHQEYVTIENFCNKFAKEYSIESEELSKFFYGILISNFDKIKMLINRNKDHFDLDEIKNYKINVQMDMGHYNISNLDNEFKVLLKINKHGNMKNKREIFQIDDKSLDSLISCLKDVYCNIKC